MQVNYSLCWGTAKTHKLTQLFPHEPHFQLEFNSKVMLRYVNDLLLGARRCVSRFTVSLLIQDCCRRAMFSYINWESRGHIQNPEFHHRWSAFTYFEKCCFLKGAHASRDEREERDSFPLAAPTEVFDSSYTAANNSNFLCTKVRHMVLFIQTF